jgi:hypothetical protein
VVLKKAHKIKFSNSTTPMNINNALNTAGRGAGGAAPGQALNGLKTLIPGKKGLRISVNNHNANKMTPAHNTMLSKQIITSPILLLLILTVF